MALDTLNYDILPYSREFDELGNLFYVERIVVEADTDGTSVTPTISFNDSDVALTAFSTSSRGFSEISVNRLGPVDAISFTPINSIEWYGVESFIRPIEMGANIVPGGMHTSFPGRTSDASTSISFDINPFSMPESARHINPILRYLYIDIETGAQTVTPTLINDAGTETALTGITTATRAISEFSILATNRIKTVRLDGDFTNSAIILYNIQIDMYIPAGRRMAIG